MSPSTGDRRLLLAASFVVVLVTLSAIGTGVYVSRARQQSVQARNHQVEAREAGGETDGSGWETLFQLVSPFDQDLAAVFPPDQVAVEDGLSLMRVGPGATRHVPTRIACPSGEVELHVTFDRVWTRASLIGGSLSYSDDHRYDFLVAVPEFDYRDTTPGELAQLPTFEEVLTKRTENRLDVYILRDGRPLRKEAARIHSSRLKLTARRRGARLELTINDLDPFAFEDPFPLPSGERGVFAVEWPPQVHVQRLWAKRLDVEEPPNPLEPADTLYAEGDYGAALDAYRTGDTLEAAYKAALCQFALGYTEAFLEQIESIVEPREQLSVERQELRDGTLVLNSQLSTLNSPSRWRLLAACRLLQHRAESDKWDDVERLLRHLSAVTNREQIALVVPAVQQELIRQYFRRPTAIPAALAGNRTVSVGELTRAALVEELFGDDPATCRMTKWQLAGAHRSCGQLDRAVAIFRMLLSEDDLLPQERMVMLADVADMLTQSGQPDAAIAAVNGWLVDAKGGYRSEYLPLLVTRAATRVAAGEAQEAQADLDYFLQHVDVQQVDHSQFAHACGLRGLLYKEEGDEEAAMDVWRKGLRRNWHEGYLEPQQVAGLRGVEAVLARNSIVFDGILGSWTGEMTQDEAYRNMSNHYPGAGVLGTSFRKLVEVSFDPEFIREVLVQESNSPLGRQQGRETLLQHTPPDNAVSFLIAFVRVSCLPEIEQTPEVEQVLEQSCRRLVECYYDGTFDDRDVRDLLNIWRGRFNESTFLRVARKAGERHPELAASAAFALGSKYVINGEREVARYLFEYTLSVDEVVPIVEKLARWQMDRLEVKDEAPPPSDGQQ